MAETTDPSKIANDLMAELNLDPAELPTITSLVSTAINVINRSSDAPEDDTLTVPAVKVLAQAMYYDRSLANGMPRGLLMMLAHSQASSSGDNNGN